MTLNYFLLQNPRSKGKFMPNTRPAYKYTDKEFFARMSRKNPQIPVNTLKEVLKTMTDTVEDVLSEGSSITIPYFMRIAPAVRGAFDSITESFNASKHRIGINCTVLPAFTEKIMKNVKVEKIKKPDRWPKIKDIIDNKTKGNVLQKNFANRIKGVDLLLKKYDFAGFALIPEAAKDKNFIIEKKQLDMIKYTKNEIVFNIDRNFIPPEWLVNDTEIYIKLRYTAHDGHIAENGLFKTKWIC